MVIRGGLVVSGKGIERKDIGVRNGRIEHVEGDLASFPALATLNVQGKLILPVSGSAMKCVPVYDQPAPGQHLFHASQVRDRADHNVS